MPCQKHGSPRPRSRSQIHPQVQNVSSYLNYQSQNDCAGDLQHSFNQLTNFTNVQNITTSGSQGYQSYPQDQAELLNVDTNGALNYLNGNYCVSVDGSEVIYDQNYNQQFDENFNQQQSARNYNINDYNSIEFEKNVVKCPKGNSNNCNAPFNVVVKFKHPNSGSQLQEVYSQGQVQPAKGILNINDNVNQPCLNGPAKLSIEVKPVQSKAPENIRKLCAGDGSSCPSKRTKKNVDINGACNRSSFNDRNTPKAVASPAEQIVSENIPCIPAVQQQQQISEATSSNVSLSGDAPENQAGFQPEKYFSEEPQTPAVQNLKNDGLCQLEVNDSSEYSTDVKSLKLKNMPPKFRLRGGQGSGCRACSVARNNNASGVDGGLTHSTDQYLDQTVSATPGVQQQQQQEQPVNQQQYSQAMDPTQDPEITNSQFSDRGAFKKNYACGEIQNYLQRVGMLCGGNTNQENSVMGAQQYEQMGSPQQGGVEMQHSKGIELPQFGAPPACEDLISYLWRNRLLCGSTANQENSVMGAQQYGQMGSQQQDGVEMHHSKGMEGMDPSAPRVVSHLESAVSFKDDVLDKQLEKDALERENRQLERFKFSSPDELRLKIQEYIANRPFGMIPVGKLKPFNSPQREAAMTCRTCYGPGDQDILPAACQPCARLEMTAADFLAEERADKKKLEDAAAAAEREAALAEMENYKNLMPRDFTCAEQVQFMECMGASEKAVEVFKEFQEEEALKKEGSNNVKQEFLEHLQSVQKTPLPDPNYRKQVLARQVMPNSQRRRMSDSGKSPSAPIFPISEEGEQSQQGQTNKQVMKREKEQKIVAELAKECQMIRNRSQTEQHSQQGQPIEIVNNKDQNYLSGLIHQCRIQLEGNAPWNNTENTDEQYRMYQEMANSAGFPTGNGTPSSKKTKSDIGIPPTEETAAPDEDGEPETYEEENEEEEAEFKKHPMFSPPKQEPERSLKDSMILYKQHLGNIRRRYFGELVQQIDSVEGITPDMAAAMIFSEEEGFSMKIAPSKMYEYLYPDQPSQPLVQIAEVTVGLPPGFDDIVVPLVPPMFLHAADYPGLEDPAMLDSPRVIQIGPSPNLADSPEITETKKPTDIAELVTGMAEAGYEAPADADVGDDEEEMTPEDVFNVKLQTTMPPHYCKMQMRGSQPPNWFPGYYYAFHSKPGVSVNETHGVILEKIWEDVQPEAVKAGGGAIIVGE